MLSHNPMPSGSYWTAVWWACSLLTRAVGLDTSFLSVQTRAQGCANSPVYTRTQAVKRPHAFISLIHMLRWVSFWSNSQIWGFPEQVQQAAWSICNSLDYISESTPRLLLLLWNPWTHLKRILSAILIEPQVKKNIRILEMIGSGENPCQENLFAALLCAMCPHI